ncbi:MAG: hypothetical protein AB7O43_21865 [Hyphomicrobiaceae bacterium]
MFRCITILVALLSSALLVSGLAAQEKRTQFLFVQSAESATLDNGVLTLKNVAPATIFFADRPKRMAGHMLTKTFLARWDQGKNSFKKDPPNATLSVFTANGKPGLAVVELKEPRLSGNNLQFKVKVQSGSLPSNGGEASLFIDGDDGGCWAGYVGSPDEPCWERQAFSHGRF